MIKETIEECEVCHGYGSSVWGETCCSCKGSGAQRVILSVSTGRVERLPWDGSSGASVESFDLNLSVYY